MAASTAAAKLSTYAAFGVSMLIKTMNAKPLINITVDEFMWGYDDNIVKLANNIVPNFITFERIGILDRVSSQTKNIPKLNLTVLLISNFHYFISQQLFDEGHNVVTMMLPEGIELINQKKQQEKEHNEKIEKAQKLTSSTEKTVVEDIQTAPLISENVPDVEYEEDYDRYNEITALDFKTEKPVEVEKKPFPKEIREYAIDMWNGTPGLKMWGYNNTNR